MRRRELGLPDSVQFCETVGAAHLTRSFKQKRTDAPKAVRPCEKASEAQKLPGLGLALRGERTLFAPAAHHGERGKQRELRTEMHVGRIEVFLEAVLKEGFARPCPRRRPGC